MSLSQGLIVNNVACGAVGTRVAETGKRVRKRNEQGDFYVCMAGRPYERLSANKGHIYSSKRVF
ncbi:hypothetical protein KSC_012200 [Ktedonobacter sp. SOSP1-52]|nr:hypothetical protein KSC_012200 [Ktedonobacter sp. SOSP1-52]